VARTASIAATLMLATAIAAGAQSADVPKVKPLERYLGAWIHEGADRTPGGGPVRCTSVRQWTGAGYFVESRRHCTTPRGELDQLEVYGYDFTERVYRYWGFNGRFVSQYSTPTMTDPAVNWSSVAFRGRVRCTETFDPGFASSRTSCETSMDGTAWVVISEGHSTRRP
jgi:hypothetical protein